MLLEGPGAAPCLCVWGQCQLAPLLQLRGGCWRASCTGCSTSERPSPSPSSCQVGGQADHILLVVVPLHGVQ